MRILFIIHQFMPEFASGTEQVTLNFAKAAQAMGHHVDVLTCSVRDRSLWAAQQTQSRLLNAIADGIPVYAIANEDGDHLADLGYGNKLETALAVSRFLDERAPYDVVHVTHAMRMLDAVEAIRWRGLPYVVTLTDFFLGCYRINLVEASGEVCRGPEGGRACVKLCIIPEFGEDQMIGRQARMRAILEGAASINAVSDYVAEVFRREHLGLNIRVVPHGVDLLRFDYKSRQRQRGELVLGYVGTISSAKGVHILAEAFVLANLANARLELVGPCFDDAFRQQLEAIIAGHERIVLRPAVPAAQIPGVLEGIDLLCIPSLVPESFSLVMYEGFAAGAPSIVSDLGSPAQVVRRHQCGAVVAVGEVDAWAAAMRQVAAAPAMLDAWRANIPLPQRVEEEGFVYDQLYRMAISENHII